MSSPPPPPLSPVPVPVPPPDLSSSSSGGGDEEHPCVRFRVDTAADRLKMELMGAAAAAALLSVVVSGALLYRHLRHYTQPRHQRCIVRLIFMVPLYAVYSVLCLYFMEYQRYFALFRDMYEAYALYMFFVLCIEYVGGRERMIIAFESCAETKLVMPLWCVVKPGRRMLKICRQGILQYAILRPLVSVISTVLMLMGLYDEGEWNWERGYPYATLFYNIGVTVSLYCLALFYKVAAEELRPFSPVLKFSAVKGIVFFTYWQSVLVSVAVGLQVVPAVDGCDSGEVATGVQNLLICFEMLVFAILFWVAFPVKMYHISTRSQAPLIHDAAGGQTSVMTGIRDAVRQNDVITDTIQAFVPGADPTSPNSRAQKKARQRALDEFDAGEVRSSEDFRASGEFTLALELGNISSESEDDDDDPFGDIPDDDPKKRNIRGRK